MKLAIVGCNGRMGKELLKLAASTGYKNKLSQVIGIAQEDNFGEALKHIDLVIDFSTVEASLNHASICVEKNIKFVCGVTGFSKDQLKLFDDYAKNIPLFWSPNMSLGVAVMNYLVKQSSKMLDQDFVVEMKETHHIKKLDAPSGTAIMLRNSINEVRDQKIDVESVREGEVVGKHSVSFVSELEKIKIKHEAFSRSVFADGALKAALWLADQKPRKVYGMSDLLGLN